MSLQVIIDRTNLDLDPLVITSYPGPGVAWWLPEDAVVEPAFAFRTTLAPESAYVPGDQPLAAVLDATSIPLAFYARAVPGVTLDQAKAVLSFAFAQFRYAISLEVGAGSASYVAFPAWPQWGPVDSGMVAAGLVRGTVTIPINPEA